MAASAYLQWARRAPEIAEIDLVLFGEGISLAATVSAL